MTAALPIVICDLPPPREPALRDVLPVIPIPLKGEAPDASLDLQALLHEVYDAAGYEDYLYSTPPEPPLSAEHFEWTKQFAPFTAALPNEQPAQT